MRTLTRDEIRSVDRIAIEDFGMPGVALMENAGRNAAAVLDSLWPARSGRNVRIVCGKGNNAGDGFVIARHLQLLRHEVTILLASPPEGLSGDAAVNHRIAERSAIPISDLSAADSGRWESAIRNTTAAEPPHADPKPGLVIVDALLGTGAHGPPRGTVATAIRAINAVRAGADGVRVLAIDLPSGLDCDTGVAEGVCVQADATVTFVARKKGFDTPAAGRFTGAVHVVGIGVPKKLLDDFERTADGRSRINTRRLREP